VCASRDTENAVELRDSQDIYVSRYNRCRINRSLRDQLSLDVRREHLSFITRPLGIRDYREMPRVSVLPSREAVDIVMCHRIALYSIRRFVPR